MPRLIPPTTSVRDSYLQGETETAIAEGLPTGLLEEAAADFAGFVAQRRGLSEVLVTCAEDTLGSRRVIAPQQGA